jgi:hypothetical protein
MVDSELNKIDQLVQSLEAQLSAGASVLDVSRDHGLPPPLIWGLKLDNYGDQDRFERLGWGLRTWDYWYWNDVDSRFGDDWPGQIPAQLVAHTLFYLTHPGDLVLDPMAGGGVVPDVCLAFGRQCWAFDLVDRPEKRPEIEPYHWDPKDLSWPVHSKAQPDLIFFDPPYFDKKAAHYEEGSISDLDKAEYLAFFERFFALAHRQTKAATRLVFLNSDWRAFQGISMRAEDPDQAITIFDYRDRLHQTGWRVTHVIDCPLSTQRFQPRMVAGMQRNRTLGVVRRSLLVAKRQGV